MAMDALIRFLFSDEGASAGVGKLNNALNQLKRSGPDARRGLAALETGMRGLALQAINVGGPVGKLAESLLRFGGGSALILGAAAGIGALVLAYRTLTSESRENIRATEDVIKKLDALSAHARIAAANMRLAAISAEREDKSPGTWLSRTAEQFLSDITGGRSGAGLAEQEQRRLRREAQERMNIATETAAHSASLVERAERAAIKAEDDRRKRLEQIEFEQAGGAATADKRGLLARQVAGQFVRNQQARDAFAPRGFSPAAIQETRETARLAGLPGAGAQAEMAEERLSRLREFTAQITQSMLTPQQSYIEQLHRVREAHEQGLLSAGAAADAERFLAGERERAIKVEQRAAANERERAASMGVSRAAAGISLGTSVLSAATGRGGIGNVLSSGGALASTFPGLQLPGLGLAGIGGIVSMFESQHEERERNADRRNEELKGVLHEGPQRATITIVNANGETIGSGLYSVQRANRLGREARLPR